MSYQGYMRDNGKEKVLFQAPGSRLSASVNLKREITSRFDVIAGIDTNTLVCNQRSLSISCAFASRPIVRMQADQLELVPTPAFIIEGVRQGLNPEPIAWYHFLTTTLPMVNGSGRYEVALVVDSELGQIPEINARSRPYYRDFYLPDGVQLIYASSDAGTDLPNQLIRQCDRGSRRLADRISRGDIVLPEALGSAWEDYEGIAFINLDPSLQLPHNA